MDKYEVAQILREIGIIIELIDENPKKGLAYRKAARTVESMESLQEVVQLKTLESFPGIGKGISKMITTVVEKGYLPYYNHLRNSIPNTLLDLTHIPGLSLKNIRLLYEKLNVTNLAELEEAFRTEKVRKLKGFGPAYIKKILQRINQEPSFLYPQAFGIAQSFLDILKPWTKKIVITGALRRKLEIMSHIDLLAIPKKGCLEIFTHHGLVKEVLSQNISKAEVLLKQGLRITLHLVEEKEFPFLFLETTGSHNHLLQLKAETLYERLVKAKDESSIYQSLELSFIPPEVREGMGEIEAAKKGYDFDLIEEKDLRGTFHCHTVDSDGQNTIEEMAQAAQKRGWEYIGISDHSKSSYQANGMDEEHLFNQLKKIKKLNKTVGNSFQVFAGLECDVLKDGQLDFPDDILKQLDFVIVSIHRYFGMEEELMTQRLLKAIENPYTTMIGHLTGRLLRFRNPYQLNIPKIIDACIANNKIIEINAYPNRLDMDWRFWVKAKEKGLKSCINPDAHNIRELDNCQYGINVARKGWLQKDDVLNTLSLQQVRKKLGLNTV